MISGKQGQRKYVHIRRKIKKGSETTKYSILKLYRGVLGPKAEQCSDRGIVGSQLSKTMELFKEHCLSGTCAKD